jgi:hypothetical protein
MTGGGAYSVEAWHDLFIASAGAAAALSGLIFVAVSINLREILAEEKKIGSTYLTGRALESLVALLVILAISIVGLDAFIGHQAFAAFLLLCAALSAVSPWLAFRAYRQSHVKPVAFNLRLFLALLLVAAYAVAGITLLAQAGGGLHWIPFCFILAIIIAASNAWILLVEVLR